MMKRIILALFLFAGVLQAQHNRQSLLAPDYDDYNLKGWPRQITVVQQYTSGSDINFQEVYSFDSTGRLSEYRKQGFGGERVTRYPLALEDISQSRVYIFDYDGDILEMRQYDQKGRLYTTTHCIYAEGGNMMMSIEYTYSSDSGAVTKRTVSSYDRKGRLAAIEQYTADELLLWSEHCRYDRRGNLVRRTQNFYTDGEKEVTEERRDYTYDSHGNWTECRYTLNGQSLYTIKRTIDYYGQ